MRSMRPRDIIAFLRVVVQDPRGLPSVIIWGPPGIGKSDVCRQVAEEAGIGFVDLRLALLDPTDLRGIPIPENGAARWLPPSFLPTEGRGILFLDELPLAPPLVQSSAFQLALDYRIGEYVLPQGWAVIAAGNRAEHGAYSFKMSAPLRNRFVHIDFEVNVDDWREWALRERLVSEVVEFISFRPDLLFQFDPARHEDAFPTPRTWEFAAMILSNQNGLPEEVVHQIIEGTVGPGAAAEFKAYQSLKADLPSAEKILAGEDFVPEQLDVTCALVTALAIKASGAQYERLLNYSDNLPAEASVLLAKLLAVQDKKALLACPSWVTWARTHSELILDLGG